MSPLHVAIIAAVTLAFGLVSRRLDRSIISSPMVYLSAGALLSERLFNWLTLGNETALHLLAELTLVIVLFTDASRINVRRLSHQANVPVRLLGIGLPLTVLLGVVPAALLFPEFSIWDAALLSAILAPTDAALGQAVVSNPQVPLRIRQGLNVESGLNDGIVLPVVLLFASLAGADSNPQNGWIAYWLMQVTIGPLCGVAVGFLGGRLLTLAIARGSINDSYQRLAGLSLAVLAYGAAESLGGNGFLATFAAGMTLGGTSHSVCPRIQEFAEAEGQLLSLLTFLMFGTVLVVPALANISWRGVIYALLSLTAVRMLPVWLSLIGLRLSSATILFVGWFGPRGLASLLYGLLIVGQTGVGEEILDVVVLTVVMSVFLHGVTAVPAANHYGARCAAMGDGEHPEHHAAHHFPIRFPGWHGAEHGREGVPSYEAPRRG